MPFPVAAAIAGGAALAGAAGQMYSTSKMNKRAEKYNWEMYKTQRYDALADWNMQNQYNSPAAQMQRFKDAGLNPNLIYGQMQDVGQMRSVEGKGLNLQPQDVQGNVGSVIAAYQNARSSEASVNLAKKQLEILDQEKLLKAAQTAAVDANTAKVLWDTETAKGIGMDYRREMLNGLEWRNNEFIKQMNRNAELHPLRVQKESQAINNMKEQIRASEVGRQLSLKQMTMLDQQLRNIKTEGELKELELKTNKLLQNVGGNVPANMLFQILMKIFGNK